MAELVVALRRPDLPVPHSSGDSRCLVSVRLPKIQARSTVALARSTVALVRSTAALVRSIVALVRSIVALVRSIVVLATLTPQIEATLIEETPHKNHRVANLIAF